MVGPFQIEVLLQEQKLESVNRLETENETSRDYNFHQLSVPLTITLGQAISEDTAISLM